MSAKEVIAQLKSFASAERKARNEGFFKTGPSQYSEHDQFIGVRVPQTRLIAKKYFKTIAFYEIDRLINHPVHEIRHCGLIILVNKYQSGDKELVFNYLLKNIHAANNWDLVDTSIPHIIGDYIFNHQDKLNILFNCAKSDNLWEKRIAIVATFAFIKNKEFNPTLKIAKILLKDSHDLINKATGWMLREVYKEDNKVCSAFLRENYVQLSRTTLRYAIERMQEKERQRYLKGIF